MNTAQALKLKPVDLAAALIKRDVWLVSESWVRPQPEPYWKGRVDHVCYSNDAIGVYIKGRRPEPPPCLTVREALMICDSYQRFGFKSIGRELFLTEDEALAEVVRRAREFALEACRVRAYYETLLVDREKEVKR